MDTFIMAKLLQNYPVRSGSYPASDTSVIDLDESDRSLQARSLPLQGWRLIDLPLRASNEHILIVRVPRAKGSSQPPPSLTS